MLRESHFSGGRIMAESTVDCCGRYHFDQLLVYQNSKDAPTFVCAIDTSRGINLGSNRFFNFHGCSDASGWHESSCDSSSTKPYYSALPMGLVKNVDALEMRNSHTSYVYSGPTAGSILRASIQDIGNEAPCGDGWGHPTAPRCPNQGVSGSWSFQHYKGQMDIPPVFTLLPTKPPPPSPPPPSPPRP